MAVRLGRVNVNQMLRSITAKQFAEWEAYARLEPFDEMRNDLRMAQIVAMVFNMAVAVKDRKPVSHFLIPWEKGSEAEVPRAEGQDWRLKKAIAHAICEAYSVPGKDLN